MQTPRNGVESPNRQKGLNIRCVCPGMGREPSTSRIGEGWEITSKIKITITIKEKPSSELPCALQYLQIPLGLPLAIENLFRQPPRTLLHPLQPQPVRS